MNKAEHNRKAYQIHKPYPLRLGDLHVKLQTDAFNKGSSIHAEALAILKNYYEKRKVMMDTGLQKLIEMATINRNNIKNHIPIRKYGSKIHEHPRLF